MGGTTWRTARSLDVCPDWVAGGFTSRDEPRGTGRGTGCIARCVQHVTRRGRRGRAMDASTRDARGSNPGAPIAAKPLVERIKKGADPSWDRSSYRIALTTPRARLESPPRSRGPRRKCTPDEGASVLFWAGHAIGVRSRQSLHRAITRSRRSESRARRARRVSASPTHAIGLRS
jgi:hypothetical protein